MKTGTKWVAPGLVACMLVAGCRSGGVAPAGVASGETRVERGDVTAYARKPAQPAHTSETGARAASRSWPAAAARNPALVTAGAETVYPPAPAAGSRPAPPRGPTPTPSLPAPSLTPTPVRQPRPGGPSPPPMPFSTPEPSVTPTPSAPPYVKGPFETTVYPFLIPPLNQIKPLPGPTCCREQFRGGFPGEAPAVPPGKAPSLWPWSGSSPEGRSASPRTSPSGGPNPSPSPTPSPAATLGTAFPGMGSGFTGPAGNFTVAAVPPDPNAAAGPWQIVQVVNTSFAVF